MRAVSFFVLKIVQEYIGHDSETWGCSPSLLNIGKRIIKIKRLIKEISPDYTISFMGNLQPILTFKQVIVSIHSNPDHFSHFYRKLFLKTIYKLPNVEKIVTVSKGIEKKLNNQ